MNNASATTDTATFLAGMSAAEKQYVNAVRTAFFQAAGELHRLSSFEVPLDEGFLLNSGTSGIAANEEHNGLPVGQTSYDTKYAIRLHEHPEYNFQNGRKGKYLEDPAKNNTRVFGRIIKNVIASFF